MKDTEKHAPLGSRYEKITTRRAPSRRIRRIKRVFNNLLEAFGCLILPLLYRLYIFIIWSTSHTTDNYAKRYDLFTKKFGGLVAMLWHQEVVTAPHVFKGRKVHTLASLNTMGRLITALLENHDFKVFRGGRRKHIVLKDMIRYLQQNPDVVYGITVDGSRGPARKMKRGSCLLAKGSGTPLFAVCTRARHCLYVPSWDEIAVTLPFNRIDTYALGPYWIDPDCDSKTFDVFCQHIEQELLSLTDYVDRKVKNGRVDPRVRKAFPETWQADRWPEGTLGLPFSEWDLQSESAPPWSQASKSAPE
ncbi:MAG: lysophospholipid acyltransferase family protein [Lentimonas sp.]